MSKFLPPVQLSQEGVPGHPQLGQRSPQTSQQGCKWNEWNQWNEWFLSNSMHLSRFIPHIVTYQIQIYIDIWHHIFHIFLTPAWLPEYVACQGIDSSEACPMLFSCIHTQHYATTEANSPLSARSLALSLSLSLSLSGTCTPLPYSKCLRCTAWPRLGHAMPLWSVVIVQSLNPTRAGFYQINCIIILQSRLCRWSIFREKAENMKSWSGPSFV